MRYSNTSYGSWSIFGFSEDEAGAFRNGFATRTNIRNANLIQYLFKIEKINGEFYVSDSTINTGIKVGGPICRCNAEFEYGAWMTAYWWAPMTEAQVNDIYSHALSQSQEVYNRELARIKNITINPSEIMSEVFEENHPFTFERYVPNGFLNFVQKMIKVDFPQADQIKNLFTHHLLDIADQ